MNCQSNLTDRQNGSLVYLNKIYYDAEQTSCPILFSLTTAADTFTQELTFGQSGRSNGCGCGCGCSSCCSCNNGCGCCDFALNGNTTFRVTDSRIAVTGFSLSTDTVFTAGDVTVDGFPVTSLTLMNGQYVADLSGIMEEITHCPCTSASFGCHCMPKDHCNIDCENDGSFILAQVPGPWVLGAAIILEGTASNGSRTCSFRLCLRTIAGAEDPGILIPGSDNFALYCVEIPCQTAGISPNLLFDIDACASLLNPVITPVCTEEGCTVTLNATLVITPEINLKVTKPALFNLNASEVSVSCDNVGQCDLCNQEESCCSPGTASSGRQNGQSMQNRQSSCSSCNQFTAACQCCDTNGYTF